MNGQEGGNVTRSGNRVRLGLAPFGGFGALLPSIVAVYSRTDGLTFPVEPRIIAGQAVYLLSASLIAAIYPYGRNASYFNAVLVGLGFPSLAGGLISFAKYSLPLGLGGSSRGSEDVVSSIQMIVDSLSSFY